MALRPPSPLMRVMVASSMSEMQSHRTLPCGVKTRSARWPIANCGRVPMPIRPGSCWRKALRWSTARASSVVHLWPLGGMNWRSSSHTRHSASGPELGGYCVPHAVQMKAGIPDSSWSRLLLVEAAIIAPEDACSKEGGFLPARAGHARNSQRGMLLLRRLGQAKRRPNTCPRLRMLGLRLRLDPTYARGDDEP